MKALLEKAPATVFVVPPPAHSRGFGNKQCRVTTKGAVSTFLSHMGPSHALLLGLGHEPSTAQAVKAQLRVDFPVTAGFTWRMLPLMQKQQRSGSQDRVQVVECHERQRASQSRNTAQTSLFGGKRLCRASPISLRRNTWSTCCWGSERNMRGRRQR